MVLSTVWRSRVELTAWPTSPNALSSPTDRDSSRVRASSSWNSRTFSMAITAWSAKVSTSAICLSENGWTSRRHRPSAPTALPSRSSGTASTVRNDICPAVTRYSGIALDVVDMSDPSIQDRAAYGDLPVERLWEPAAGLFDLRLGHTVVSVERDHLTIEPVQSGKRRLAEPIGAPD